jgi:hypothetical protein
MLQIVLAMLASGVTPVAEEATPQCGVRYATRYVSHFAGLPEQIQKDILSDGDIADVGQPFEPYDYIIDPNLPNRRMVMAGQSGVNWFVWIDHGGFSRHYDVIGYSQIWEKDNTYSWYRTAELQGDPCIAINAILDGVTSLELIEKKRKPTT